MEKHNTGTDQAPTTRTKPSEEPTPEATGEDAREGVSGLQVVQSTLAAALGVQSSKNRKRDFAEGRASQFVIAGIVFTAAFVGIMVLIVRTVLAE